MDNQIEASQLNQILQFSPNGVMVLDAEGRITWANRTIEQILGKSASELQGQITTDMAEVNLTELPDGTKAYQILQGATRTERWFSCYSQQLVSDAANSQRVEYLVDITAIKSLQAERDLLSAQLQEIAPIDPNSGLLTEKAIMQNVDLLVSRSRRYENPLSVIVMSVDLAKVDAESEQVMHSIGQLLKDQMRWADLICRVNDNQILMVLPETDNDATAKLVDKINSYLGSLAVPYGEGKAVAIEAEFGLSSWEKGDDRSIMMNRAFDALKATA